MLQKKAVICKIVVVKYYICIINFNFMQTIIENLLDLGFNRLEAEVYIHLLSHSSATAYKVGKLINKPTANVYKAIDSLAIKGAVMLEEDKTKRCKAVRPEEFFNLYETRILNKSKSLRHSLKNLQNDEIDQSSYSIKSIPLVFEKVKNMIANAKKIIVVDAFPKALQKITHLLTDAGSKGVEVFIEAYEDCKIPNTQVTFSKTVGSTAIQHWNSQQLNIMIDGEVYLIALMDNDLKNVKQATYSHNIYMSCMLLASSLKEQTIIQLLNIQKETDFESRAKEILNQTKFFYNTEIPGFNKLSTL